MNRFILLLACLLGFAALIRGSPVTNEPVDDAFESSEADVDLDKRSPPIPWDQIKIEDVVYGGSGCPAGSAAWSISSDKQALTVIYDQFIAQAGPGITFAQNRRFCQLSVKMHFPQGLTFSITKLDARGHATLDPGAKASHQTTFYFSGETQQANLKLNFPAGPYDKDYLLTTSLLDAQLVWCPCGANRDLQVKQTIQTTNYGHPQAEGLLTVDTNDLKVTTIFHLQWKWCN